MSQFDFWNSGRRILKAAVVACLLAAATTGSAQAANYVGWVYGNQPNATSSYTPDASYSYNSAGGSITIVPISTGVYEVEFGGLYGGQPDDVQITAVNPGGGYCQSGGWYSSGTTVYAYVECFTYYEGPANEMFTLLYQARTSGFGSSSKGIAYLYANNPSASSYTPNTSYQFNSTGGTNTIVRNSTGNYTANIPGLEAYNSDVQVTAYNRDDFPAHCNVVSWGANSGGTAINVQCYSRANQNADEIFTLAYTVNEPIGLTTSESHSEGAFAWANDDSDTSVYTPDTTYQYNGFGTGNLTAQKLSTGQYMVTIPGNLSYNTQNILVTAYGNNANVCNGFNFEPPVLEVLCVVIIGSGAYYVDSQFDVTWQTAE